MAAAFAEETPTIPRHGEARALSQHPEAQGPVSERADEEVSVDIPVDVVMAAADESEPDSEPIPSLVPLDVVPVLAVPRAEVPWTDLGELATQLLLRVDGSAQTMAIVTGIAVAPNEGARELAALVRRGLLRLEPPPSFPVEASSTRLDLDLSVV